LKCFDLYSASSPVGLFEIKDRKEVPGMAKKRFIRKNRGDGGGVSGVEGRD
jgi:hypothetical protein